MAKQERKLEGLHVAISGGARGIGETTARMLAKRGAKVSLGDINVEGVETTAATIAEDARKFGDKRAIGL
ncbi:SDR family NAD(P)-dependent oxidoreductase, partial [Dietzia sp.]|uniref:SDR family NAD(P)-dependent oxidoreductase n=1 Tax=Dietzia sp. TaxID=1871616 RepID=UPI002FDB4544